MYIALEYLYRLFNVPLSGLLKIQHFNLSFYSKCCSCNFLFQEYCFVSDISYVAWAQLLQNVMVYYSRNFNCSCDSFQNITYYYYRTVKINSIINIVDNGLFFACRLHTHHFTTHLYISHLQRYHLYTRDWYINLQDTNYIKFTHIHNTSTNKSHTHTERDIPYTLITYALIT